MTKTKNDNDDHKNDNNNKIEQYITKQQSRVPNGSGIIDVRVGLEAEEKTCAAAMRGVGPTPLESKGTPRLGSCSPLGRFAGVRRGQEERMIVTSEPTHLDGLPGSANSCMIAVDEDIEPRMEVAVGAEDCMLLEDSIDGGQELSDDGTEDDMPEIGDSDPSHDEDLEILHKRYGYGWQDIRDKRRTRRLDREEEQRIAVGEIAVARLIGAPNNDLTRSVAGSCRSADDGSIADEFNNEDAMRQSSEPKPRADNGSGHESTRSGSEKSGDDRQASTVSLKLDPPMMRMSIAERKRVKKARDKERRDISHRAATEYEEW